MTDSHKLAPLLCCAVAALARSTCSAFSSTRAIPLGALPHPSPIGSVIDLAPSCRGGSACASTQLEQARSRVLERTSASVLASPNHPLFMSPSEDEASAGAEESLATPLDNPLLAAVDALAFLAFAAVGKASHSADGSLDAAAVAITAFPFILSWFVTAPFLGCYDPQMTARSVPSALQTTAKGWIVAVPLGCVLRGFIKGYVPPAPFVVVTMISTLLILGAARVGYSKVQTSVSEFLG